MAGHVDVRRGRGCGETLVLPGALLLTLVLAAPAAGQAVADRAPAGNAAARLHPSVQADPIAALDPAAAQETSGSYAWAGAAAGAVVGGGLTWVGLHTGGSTSLCDRDANQDAMSAGECAALTAAGALVGAAVGFLVGSRIGRDGGGAASLGRLHVGRASGGGLLLGTRLRL